MEKCEKIFPCIFGNQGRLRITLPGIWNANISANGYNHTNTCKLYFVVSSFLVTNKKKTLSLFYKRKSATAFLPQSYSRRQIRLHITSVWEHSNPADGAYKMSHSCVLLEQKFSALHSELYHSIYAIRGALESYELLSASDIHILKSTLGASRKVTNLFSLAISPLSSI